MNRWLKGLASVITASICVSSMLTGAQAQDPVGEFPVEWYGEWQCQHSVSNWPWLPDSFTTTATICADTRLEDVFNWGDLCPLQPLDPIGDPGSLSGLKSAKQWPWPFKRRW